MSRKLVAKPEKPDASIVTLWASKGWKHTGLGMFRNKDGDRAQLHLYDDGSTGLRVTGFCALTGPFNNRKRTP